MPAVRKQVPTIALVLAGALAAQGVRAQPAAAPPTATAPDPTGALIQSTCAACHDIGQVTSMHQDAAGWSDTVDKMIGLGAQVSDGDRPRIIAWLAAHQGPAQP